MPASQAASSSAKASSSVSPLPKSSGAEPMPPKFPHPRPIRESSSEVPPRRRYSTRRPYRATLRFDHEGAPASDRALARAGRASRRRDGRRLSAVGAPADRLEAGRLRTGRGRRFGLRRLRRERRLRGGARSAPHGPAPASLLRDRGRDRFQRRPAVRRRDRRLRRTPGVSVYDELKRIVDEGESAVLFTVIEGEPLGAKLLVWSDGKTVGDGPPDLAENVGELLARGRGRVLEQDGRRVFAEVFAPPPRLLVFGAVDTAEALCAAAKQLGWRTIVADARARFATPERLPSADEIVLEWPAEALAQVKPDASTAVIVLTHDEKFDLPALQGAPATDAFYVGALGSRRAQAKRRDRLADLGVPEQDLDRIAGPCGLDIGAETPPETALSILSEILATRAGRGGGRLRESQGSIHVERSEAPAPS